HGSVSHRRHRGGSHPRRPTGALAFGPAARTSADARYCLIRKVSVTAPCRAITFEPRSDYMAETRKETDSLGVVEVPADKLWGAQTQRSLEHFSIGRDLIPPEMITAHALLTKPPAAPTHASKRLDDRRYKLIVQVCDEILAGKHH